MEWALQSFYVAIWPLKTNFKRFVLKARGKTVEYCDIGQPMTPPQRGGWIRPSVGQMASPQPEGDLWDHTSPHSWSGGHLHPPLIGTYGVPDKRYPSGTYLATWDSAIHISGVSWRAEEVDHHLSVAWQSDNERLLAPSPWVVAEVKQANSIFWQYIF